MLQLDEGCLPTTKLKTRRHSVARLMYPPFRISMFERKERHE